MKKIIILLCTFVLCHTATSQQDSTTMYMSIFGDGDIRWEGVISCPVEVSYQYIESSKSDNDTVGDTICYKINHETGFGYYYINGSSTYSALSYINLFARENDNHSKLFLRYKKTIDQSLCEIMVMDLDMEVGDTLYTRDWIEKGAWNIPRIMIDSIFYKDGRKYLRTDYTMSFVPRLYPSDDTLYFIEGFGPSIGMLYPFIQHRSALSFITCYKINEELEYTIWPYRHSCIWREIFDGIQSTDIDDIIISPNPSNGIVWVFRSEAYRANYSIVSMAGKTLVRGTLVDGQTETEIDISSLPKDVYLFVFMQNDSVIRRKLIKI